jgi:hypothetical protein
MRQISCRLERRMRQRGKVSVAAASMIALDRPPLFLQPPASLNAKEAVLFSEIVTSCAADHFRKSDLPMLCAYVQASLLSRKLIRTNAINDWEKASRIAMALATKLRLTVQSRIEPRGVGRQQIPSGPAPWDRVRAEVKAGEE